MRMMRPLIAAAAALSMLAPVASAPLGSASLYQEIALRYRGGSGRAKRAKTFKKNARAEAKRLRRRVSRR